MRSCLRRAVGLALSLTFLSACAAKREPLDPTESPAVWTWVSGSDETWEAGVYGTKGVASPANVPGARYRAASWIDSAGRLWLFGGDGRDSTGWHDLLNDLWMFDPGTSEWTWISGSDLIDDAGSYGTKGVAVPSNVPGARYSSVCWADGDGRFWLFGGIGFVAPGTFGRLNDLWSFDPMAGVWTWMGGSNGLDQLGVYGTKGLSHPSNCPGARDGAVCWWDPAGRLWLFGGSGFGQSGYAGVLNDLWRLEGSTLEWTWVAGDCETDQLGSYGTKGVGDYANVPGARLGSATWRDSAGRLWLFGGQGWGSDFDGNVFFLNDLWSFDPSSGDWTWVAGSDRVGAVGDYGSLGVAAATNIAGARLNPACWHGTGGAFWLFGGVGYGEANLDGLLCDLWEYNQGSGLWTWMGGPKNPNLIGTYGTLGVPAAMNHPGSRSCSASWVDSQGRHWLFGGYGYGTDATYSGLLNDLWRYDRPR
jgi:N-acetylneuraminic acid mutarotase